MNEKVAPADGDSTSTLIRPAKAPRAPQKGRYRLSSLLDVPNRLLHPGQLIEKELEKRGMPYGGATAGEIRGGRVKLCDLQLDDVLAGKYTPPISLKDFEDFLCFRTKSAENMYFSVWYKAYKNLYNSSTPGARSHYDLTALQASYNIAVDTFFSARSPLEINLDSQIRRTLDTRIDDLARDTNLSASTENFLPPDAFEPAYSIAYESLGLSFKAFLVQAARNADRNRGWFAIFLGVSTVLLGLIPTIVRTQLNLSRGYSALGIFFFWFGTFVMVGGLKRTCGVIYLFGDNRQLYQWELARETDAGSSFGTQSTLEEGRWEGDSLKSSPNPEDGSSRRSSSIFPDMNYFPLPRTPSLSEKSVKSSTATTQGGLYFAPAYINETLAPSSKVWAPFTPMLNPIVARAQREIVLAGAGYGLLVAVILGGICLAVPNRRS